MAESVNLDITNLVFFIFLENILFKTKKVQQLRQWCKKKYKSVAPNEHENLVDISCEITSRCMHT